MTVRPTRGLAVAALLAPVLHLLTRAAGGQWLALEAGIAVAVVVAAVLLRPRLDALEVRLLSPDRATRGEPVQQLLVLRNPSRRSLPALRWVDDTDGLEVLDVEVPALGAGQEVRLPVQRAALLRGAWDPAGCLRSTAPLGVLVTIRRLAAEQLLVRPALGAALPPQGDGDPGREGAPSGQAGVGLEVLGLRGWRPGDSAREVSARASARHGRPVVLERERERAPGAPLVVAFGDPGADEQWEAAVSDVAATVASALAERRRVVLATGTGTLEPRTLDEALDLLAVLDSTPPLSQQQVLALEAAHPGCDLLELRRGGVVRRG